MLFNSLDFAVFLPIVFIFYWLSGKHNLKCQNIFILLASYYFYACWNWRFLVLIILSSCVDYYVGLGLSSKRNQRTRRGLLLFSVCVNLGILGIFKYYNFFVYSFVKVFSFAGYSVDGISTLNIILPVGISFYTFQTMSYSIDVYRRKMEPVRDVVAFFAFVSFFPQLVAGPIERAANLLPQFLKERRFNYEQAVDGMRQILWGLFKKIVIADNCAKHVDIIFDHYTELPGSSLLLGAVFFAFQIYGDFSGYSDIAIGTARLFNFDLMRNFAFPYFSRDIAEFWRRWHISLSTWFRDYVYIPLGGSRVSFSRRIFNVFIIFMLSGLWHGASWTFVVWGLLNAVYFLPLLLKGTNRLNTDTVAQDRCIPNIGELCQIITTFLLVVIGWIFFRSPSVLDSIYYISRMATSLFLPPAGIPVLLLLLLVAFILIEWIQRERMHGLCLDRFHFPRLFRWSIYAALLAMCIITGGEQQPFIYFQF